MKGSNTRRFVIFAIFITTVSVCGAQPPAATGPVGRTRTGFFSRVFDRKTTGGVKKPKSAAQVQKEQEKKDKKKNEAYAKSVKENKERSFKIQTPEVQARMKQDQKDIIDREKARKKKESESTRRARKKFKK